ncbi:hypothetical protein [Streptomyces sp. HB2AG]|uniref:hypothetical protein n=1 Tax=Streptomyces sp. HB2AG TaxID=2983400 RepID=UPI0022AB21FE|nr:hypothetical protein [Streptomyces sp. HB2AG]MCZ2525195.1 hypothetical protein [Streptomyces sp. HB2AG]
MYRKKPERRSTAWTRLTGTLVVVAVYAALIAGILPLAPDSAARDLRLALVGCTVVCVLMWVTASVRAPRTDPVVLDKAGQRKRRPSRILRILLALAVPLASGAALVQAVGPDGEQGRWVSEVYAAGGGTYEVPVDKVLDEPRPTGVNINDVDEYAADVAVTLRYDDGARSVTVRGATTVGRTVAGDTVAVVYAPGDPGLGARHNDSGFFSSGFALIWIWALTLFAGVFAASVLAEDSTANRNGIRSVRRFEPRVHGTVALILSAGVCLLLPGAFFHTSTWAGWLLALAAASTPWLALAWVAKQA